MPQARLAGISGILFVVLSALFPLMAGLFPAYGASAAEVLAYYEAHRAGFLWGNYLAIVAGPFSLALLAHLCWRIRRSEGERGWWWLVTLAGGLMVHAVGAVDLLLFQVAGLLVTPERLPMGLALHEASCIGFDFFLVMLFGSGVASGIAILKSGAYRPALGWASVACGLWSLVGSLGAIGFSGPLAAGGLVTISGFSSFVAWSFWLSVEMLREAPLTDRA